MRCFLPPMAAGIFGYMGYDTVRLIEQLPEMTPDTLGVPGSAPAMGVRAAA